MKKVGAFFVFLAAFLFLASLPPEAFSQQAVTTTGTVLDAQGNPVVIELKKGRTSDETVGQISR
jgi:hypothetical protein